MTPPAPLAPSGRSVLVRSVVAAVLVAAALFVVGLDVVHVVALAVGVAAVTAAVQSFGPAPAVGWPAPPDPDDSTGWHQVRLLGQTLDQLDSEPGRIDRVLLPRLRAVAGSRLTALGVDPASAAARELLGPDLHDRLGGTGSAGTPRLSPTPRRARPATDLVRAVLDRLDELDARSTDRPTEGDRP